ncbi:MAG TPA: polysaccharide deacetylase family protein [Candidatus Limnocylindrales bacterium]
MRPPGTISVDLDPVDVHLRGYGHPDLDPDPLVPTVATTRLLDLFRAHGVVATFFVLTRDVPLERAAILAIRDAGHEIASHGIDHPPHLAQRPTDEIAAEVSRSRAELEAITGTSVSGFRAPDWSVGPRLVGALGSAGYRYDASLVPTPVLTAGRAWLAIRARSSGALRDVRPPASLRRAPFQWRANGASVVEFPLSVSTRLRVPIYHTLRASMGDARFDGHLDGLARAGTPLSYALHAIDALGTDEDGVDQRLRGHPGMGLSLDAKLDLLDRTIGAIARTFDLRSFADRVDDLAGDGR